MAACLIGKTGPSRPDKGGNRAPFAVGPAIPRAGRTSDRIRLSPLEAGRRLQLTGTLTISGSTGKLSLASASLTVDMTTLASDRDRRDGQLKGRAIETDRFPTSTFELAGPVALPTGFGSSDVAVTLPEKLTLHGVTKDVEIASHARQEADCTVVVAGSLPVLFSDYGIEAPNVAGIIAVQDNGTIEFRVVLAKG